MMLGSTHTWCCPVWNPSREGVRKRVIENKHGYHRFAPLVASTGLCEISTPSAHEVKSKRSCVVVEVMIANVELLSVNIIPASACSILEPFKL